MVQINQCYDLSQLKLVQLEEFFVDWRSAFKWLAVKTASEMTYTVSGGALNSTQTKPNQTNLSLISHCWLNDRKDIQNGRKIGDCPVIPRSSF